MRTDGWRFRLACLPLLLALASCGSQPAKVVDRPAISAEAPASPVTARKSFIPAKRGGGYYKDDGPGDEIPDNLDDIPDAIPRFEPLHRFANRPYIVLGKSYVPDTSVKPFRQRGIASWYGKKFHGQKTSIGEPYDMFSMTAAHPTLAIPSYVRVTNVSSGKSVVVRVTDRGPFHADRVIDLSYAAAHRLGYIDSGSTLVEVEAALPDASTPLSYASAKPPAAPARPVTPGPERDEIELLAAKLAHEAQAPASKPSAVEPSALAQMSGVFLQLGAFSNSDNAENLRAHLSRELDWLNEGILIKAGGGMHRVHLGPYKDRNEAEKVAEKIRLALGYRPTVISR